MYGVDLRLDPALEAAVAEVWRDLDAAGVKSLATWGHHRHVPHLSLAVGRDLGDVPEEAFAGLVPPLAVTLTAAATFGTDGGVVFLAAQPTAALLAFQAEVAGRCGTELEVHSRPGAWTPHVTLAMEVRAVDLGRAVQAAVPYLPLSGTYTALEVVSASTGERRRLATC